MLPAQQEVLHDVDEAEEGRDGEPDDDADERRQHQEDGLLVGDQPLQSGRRGPTFFRMIAKKIQRKPSTRST